MDRLSSPNVAKEPNGSTVSRNWSKSADQLFEVLTAAMVSRFANVSMVAVYNPSLISKNLGL
jgi:hypothetical protein